MVRRRELVERFGVDRSALYCEGARWTLAELLDRFIAANEHWRPATRYSNTSVARFLSRDPVGEVGLAGLSPGQVESAFSRWRSAGASPALVWARWAVLRSALSWTASRGVHQVEPVGRDAGRRRGPLPANICSPTRWPPCSPPRPPRWFWPLRSLRASRGTASLLEALFVAEQTQLLVRLAADTGARRGELAVLRSADLDGRVLTIERNLSLERSSARPRPTEVGVSRWEPQPPR